MYQGSFNSLWQTILKSECTNSALNLYDELFVHSNDRRVLPYFAESHRNYAEWRTFFKLKGMYISRISVTSWVWYRTNEKIIRSTQNQNWKIVQSITFHYSKSFIHDSQENCTTKFKNMKKLLLVSFKDILVNTPVSNLSNPVVSTEHHTKSNKIGWYFDLTTFIRTAKSRSLLQ